MRLFSFFGTKVILAVLQRLMYNIHMSTALDEQYSAQGLSFNYKNFDFTFSLSRLCLGTFVFVESVEAEAMIRSH